MSTGSPDPIRVLHVDDEPDFAQMAGEFISRHDERLEVTTLTSASEALDRLEQQWYDCIVSDFDMPGQNGIEFLEAVRDDHSDRPFILYTGKGSEEVASEAISRGVSEYLQKESGTSQYELLANRILTQVEKQRAESQLRHREERLNLFFEQSPLGVIRWDDEFNFARLNDTARDILGYDEDELVGEAWEIVVPEEDREEIGEIVVDDLLADEGGYHSINENVRKDGTRIVCEWHNWVVKDDRDEVVAVFSQFQDITDREARERLLASFDQELDFSGDPERYADFFENAAVPMHWVGSDGTVLRANQAELDALGYSRDEYVGHHIADFHADQDVIEDILERLGAGEVLQDYEARMVRKDGSIRHVLIDSSVHWNDGDFMNTRCVTRDVTERKQLEEKLRETIANLERSNEHLDQFASVVSHDLRNPLRTAEGNLELLKEEYESERIETIERSLTRMDNLIEDLLTLAREGRKVSEMEDVDLGELTEHCWQTVETDGARIDTDVDRTIQADRSRLQQLLENLIRNAIEHGGGDVTVTVGELENGFFVEDDGLGIPESERDDIFGPSYSTDEEGTGFGLSIVKEIADAHGWSIAGTEGDAGGARFEITNVELI